MKKEYLMPESASTWAPQIDALYWALVGMSVILAVGIFVAICVLAWKYRRTPERQTGVAVIESRFLEIIWSIIPFFIGIGIFAWGAIIYLETRVPPEGALEISVVGKQWMWKLQHPEGRREINQLHIPIGRPVVLRMISQDVLHSFYIPAFRIKQDVLPHRYQTLWFHPTKTGTYHLFCAEYCGKDHSEMIGQVTVMTQEGYDSWLMQDRNVPLSGPLAVGPPPPVAPTVASAVDSVAGAAATSNQSPVEVGKDLFAKMACLGCHLVENGVGPRMDKGLFGTTVELSDGRKVKFDENYIRESILNPSVKIVKGYNNLMPSFAGRVSEEDILALIAYIKSLGKTP